MKKALISMSALIMLVAGAVQAEEAGGEMSFFITSEGPGDGANLGGLAGADAHCASLAGDDREWRAYLSTQAEADESAIDARDRIGSGPWFNAAGVRIAEDVDDLHSDDNNVNKETALDENGETVNGRGDTPNKHDILTGSTLEGTAFTEGQDRTCSNWASNGGDGSAEVGHHDRTGGGANPTSWNSAHGSRGCSQEDLQGTGGNGLFYCFATD